MSYEPVDLKLYLQATDFLQRANLPTRPEGADSKAKPQSGPDTSSYMDLPFVPKNDMDEVYPNLILGNRKICKRGKSLMCVGVTHVVNASMGSKFNQTDTDGEFYKAFDIAFHGIPAVDISTFNIFPHLRPAVDFIDKALNDGGKVYVHCQQGVSRSATVVLAYLMLKKDIDLMTALRQIRDKRSIYPNDGFLKQLCHLQKEIQGGKTTSQEPAK